MITLERKTNIQKKIANWLKKRQMFGKVRAHSYEIERRVIPSGMGSLSVSRYLRAMRQQGLIEYRDPRSIGHYYVIHLTPKFFEWLENEKKEGK